MKVPEEVKRELTHSWLLKAEDDFRTVEHLSKSGMDFAYGVVFHAQQAVEKYLKASLVWEQIEFPKTHDIATLLILLSKKHKELTDTLTEAAELTPYGVSYRYPGDSPQVSPDEVKRALEIASHVRQRIIACLPDSVWNDQT
jgi:HEPN domain-containing protein